MAKPLTQETVRRLFQYDQDTGVLTRIGGSRQTTAGKIGKRAGSVNAEGYRRLVICGTEYPEHRVIWLYMTGAMPPLIDHRNGDRADNKWANLRDASPAVNSQNIRRAKRHSSTGLLGAFTFKDRYRSIIAVNGRRIFLGEFETAQAAHEAYMAAKAVHHAEAVGSAAC